MRHKKPLLIALSALLILAGGLVMPAGLFAQLPSNDPVGAEQQVTWQLTDSRVVDTGQIAETPEGSLITGYTVESTAAAPGKAPVKAGLFRMTLSFFSPKNDMPGQRAGFWYVQGSWTITNEKASRKAREARHSAAVVKGSLNAELSFNPAVGQGPVEARVDLPMSPLGRWNKGLGTFSGDEKFNGEISVTLNRLPKAK